MSTASAGTPTRLVSGPVVVEITSAKKLSAATRRALSRELLHAGTHGLSLFELIVLKHTGSPEMREVISTIESLRKQLMAVTTRAEERQITAGFRTADRSIEELMAAEPQAVVDAKAIVAELQQQGLLVNVSDGKLRPCVGFPFRYYG
jgi:hypothetical protein